MVHEVRDTGDRDGLDRQRLDQRLVRRRRGRYRDRLAVVDVVGESDAYASNGRAPDRVADDCRGLAAEIEVVLREVERALRAVEERGDRVCDLHGRLPAVGQSTDLDAWVHA